MRDFRQLGDAEGLEQGEELVFAGLGKGHEGAGGRQHCVARGGGVGHVPEGLEFLVGVLMDQKATSGGAGPVSDNLGKGAGARTGLGRMTGSIWQRVVGTGGFAKGVQGRGVKGGVLEGLRGWVCGQEKGCGIGRA